MNQNQKLDLLSVGLELVPLSMLYIDLVVGFPFGPVTSKMIEFRSELGSFMAAWNPLVFLEATLSFVGDGPAWASLRSLVPVLIAAAVWCWEIRIWSSNMENFGIETLSVGAILKSSQV